MKSMKRILAALLMLALALSLGLPAAAVTRNDIYITGPEGTVPFGEAFTLSVEVKNLPAGTEIESYQWKYRADFMARIDGATEAALRVAPGDACYPKNRPYYAAKGYYSCDVTFAEKDTDGEVIKTFTLSNQDHIEVIVAPERKRNFGELLQDSFYEGLGIASFFSVMSGYLLLPLFPVFLVGGWIYAIFYHFFT